MSRSRSRSRPRAKPNDDELVKAEDSKLLSAREESEHHVENQPLKVKDVDLFSVREDLKHHVEDEPLKADDAEVLSVREELKKHVEKFNAKLSIDNLLARYRRCTSTWAASGDTGNILRHTVHVAAWLVFCDGTFGKTREVVLEDVANLLTQMLSARNGAIATPRLTMVLRHVEELCQEFADDPSAKWAPICEAEVRKAIVEHDAAYLRSHLGEQKPVSRKAKSEKTKSPGYWGRTDQAVVRNVLGAERYAKLSEEARIYWDGRQKRWYATKKQKKRGNIRGTNALMKRFADDKAAIEHVANVLGV